MDAAEEARKAEKAGWIKAHFTIEALTAAEDKVRPALEKHVAKMKKEKHAIIANERFREVRKVTQPVPQVPEAYSCIVEMDVLTERFERLLYLVVAFGPTSVEILAPAELKLKMGEAQTILNGVADIIHRFAQAGVGGLVIEA